MILEGTDLKALTTAIVKSNSINFFAENVFSELVDEITLGICFDLHRSIKTGLFPLVEIEAEGNTIVSNAGIDVFGQVVTTAVGVPALKKQPECICPNCQRNLAASRFAPHLEKCMGMGRNSSRLASRRLATSSKDNNGGGGGGEAGNGTIGGSNMGVAGGGNARGDEDDVEDEDWIEPGKSLSRRKRDKNSPRRNRGLKFNIGGFGRNTGEHTSDGSMTPPANSYDQLSTEERVNLLSTICGVFSMTSRKLCTRSTRCPVHTDAQRREVRIRWLGPANHDEESHVDIDSFTEGDTVALRESLALLSNGSSPADSTSSNPSNSRGSSGRSSKNNRRGGKRAKTGSKNGSRGPSPPFME